MDLKVIVVWQQYLKIKNLFSMKEIFSQIYKTNLWGSKETVSGAGSELKSTITLRKELPILFKKYNISRKH